MDNHASRDTASHDRFRNIAKMLVDSQKGYSEAAEIAKDPHIQKMFAERAAERARLVGNISRASPGFHADPDEGTVAGAGHRMFLNLRRLVQDDTKVALSEVERGEEAFLSSLRDALDDQSLTGAERGLVAELHTQVLADKERFATLARAY